MAWPEEPQWNTRANLNSTDHENISRWFNFFCFPCTLLEYALSTKSRETIRPPESTTYLHCSEWTAKGSVNPQQELDCLRPQSVWRPYKSSTHIIIIIVLNYYFFSATLEIYMFFKLVDVPQIPCCKKMLMSSA